MLKVKVKGATNLPDVDKFSGKSDPYAIVSFQGESIGLNNVLLLLFVVLCSKDVLYVNIESFNLISFWYFSFAI